MRITDVSKLRGPLGKLNNQLFGDNGAERLAALNLWLKKDTTVELLEFVQTIKVPVISRFVASDVLGADGVNKDGVKIVFRDDNFKKQFVSLIEENVGPAKLIVNRLMRYVTALDIASAIPENKRAVRVAHIYKLVCNQKANGKGPLLTNGWTNLFFAYGADGNLWSMDVFWQSGGWCFDADPLGSPGRWVSDRQVFSRK